MNKYLLGLGIFMAGVVVGWLNPVEGPLDWAYDDYASHPAHKTPSKVAPIPNKEKPLLIWFFEDEEENSMIQSVQPIINITPEDEGEE